MTTFFDLLDALPAVPFYGVLGVLMLVFAATERIALRSRS